MLSIVVIGLDEGEALRAALESALGAAAAAPVPCEVLYSDAGSADGSVARARELGLRTVAPPSGRRNAAAARNAGWRAARGEWVQFLDGDMRLDVLWIERALRAAADPEVAAVGGRLDERRARASVFNAAFGHDWPTDAAEDARLGGAALWRRTALEALGGFDESLSVGEDPDLCLRALESGHRVRRIGAPMADHDLDLRSFGAYWRRGLAVGRSRARVARAARGRRQAVAGAPAEPGAPTESRVGRHARETRRAARRPVLHVSFAGIAGLVALVALVRILFAPGAAHEARQVDLARLAAAASASVAAFALVLVVRGYRRDRRRGLAPRDAWIHALHLQAVKLPVALGVLGARSEPPVPRASFALFPGGGATPDAVAARGGPAVPPDLEPTAPMRIALLAPRLPVRSETFVFREVLSLEAAGAEAVPCALRPSPDVPDEARELARRVDVLYADRRRLVADAVAELLHAPRRGLGVLLLSLRDAVRGRFPDRRARALVPLQAFAGLALARRLRRAGATHLHVHFAHSAATVAMYAGRQAGIPLSITGHARDLFVDGGLLREKVARADRFATISDAARRRLARAERLDPDRIELAPCGVDLERFRPGGAPVAGRVVAVGRLVEKKGFDVLLDALARTARDLSLVLAGDGPERPALERRARELGLADRVRFAGALDGDAVLDLLRTAEIFALPSRPAADGDADGVPVALVEAMAVAVPVVSTRCAGIPELVTDGVHGRLVEPGDAEGLAAAVDGLGADPAAVARLGRAGRARVQRERDQRVLAARLLDRLSAGSASAPDPDGVRAAAAAAPPVGRRVVLVTPARDEAEHLPRLARSLLRQGLRPLEWVIVDDGSTDGTTVIARELAAHHAWIRVVERGDRGARVLGGGVIEAFDAGYATVDAAHDYVAKLDADLSFEPTYLERLLAEFERDPRLGSASGKVFRPESGGLVEEFMIDAMVAGQFKLYRRECLERIGGFVRAVMWDGIDFHRARQQGWRTRSFADPELRLVHHRLMGSSDRSVHRGRLRWGRGQWFMGTHPLYLLASATLRMLERPRVVGGLLIVVGYLQAALGRAPRYADRGFRRELRRWQLARLGRLVGGGVVR